MGVQLGSAYGKIVLDASGVKEGTREASGALDSFEKRAAGVGTVIQGILGAEIIKRVVQGFKDIVGSAVGAGSDLNETANKIDVVFGQASDSINDFAQAADDALGQSTQSALDAAATFGVFGKSAGLSGDDLAGFATRLTGLSSDLASFYNTSPEEAIEAIGAALRGESEPIRKYGVLLDDATLRQKAFEMGLISTTKQALTPAQKVLASYNVILDQTADAQGDFARTSDGLANQQRIMAAQTENLKTRLGGALVPAVQKLMQVANRFLASETLTRFLDGAIPKVQTFADGVVRAIDIGTTMLSYLQGVAADGDYLNDVLTQLPASVQPVAKAVGALMAGDFDAFKTMIPPEAAAALDWLAGTIQTVTTTVQNNLPALQAFGDGLRTNLVDIAGRAQSSINTVIDTVSKLITSFQTFDGDVVGALADFAYKMGFDDFGDQLLSVAATVETVIGTVRGIIEGFVAAARGWWSEHGATIMAVVATAWRVVQGVIAAAVAVIGPAIDAMIVSIQQAFASMGPMISAFQQLWVALGPVLAAVFAVIGALLLALIGLVVGAVTGLAQAIGPFLTMIMEMATGLATYFTGVIGIVTGLFNLLVGLFTGNGLLIQQAWQQMTAGVQQMTSGVAMTVTALFTGLWNTVTALVSGLVTGTLGFFNNLYFQLTGQVVPNMVNGVIAWLSKLPTEGLKLVQSFATKIVSAIKDKAGEFMQAGVDLIEGLKQGIEKKFAEVIARARELMANLVQIVKSIMGIQSPSKVFAKIGEQNMAGLAQGMLGSAGLPEKALASIAGSLISTPLDVPWPTPQTGGSGGSFTQNNNYHLNSEVDAQAVIAINNHELAWQRTRMG